MSAKVKIQSFGKSIPRAGEVEPVDVMLRDVSSGLFAIATGQPDGADGASSAQIAIEAVQDELPRLRRMVGGIDSGKASWDTVRSHLRNCLELASGRIRSSHHVLDDEIGPTASATFLVVHDRHVVVAHVGSLP